jgi:hypothetical protein
MLLSGNYSPAFFGILSPALTRVLSSKRIRDISDNNQQLDGKAERW